MDSTQNWLLPFVKKILLSTSTITLVSTNNKIKYCVLVPFCVTTSNHSKCTQSHKTKHYPLSYIEWPQYNVLANVKYIYNIKHITNEYINVIILVNNIHDFITISNILIYIH